MSVPLDAMRTRDERDDQAVGRVEAPTGGYHDAQLGLILDELTVDTAKRLGYAEPVSGVLVTHVTPRSMSSKEGVCTGMVVLRVENHPIRNVADFRRAVSSQSLEKGILVLVATPIRKHFVLIQK